MKKKQSNPWDVLGIQPDSNLKEVKQAYKNLSMLHHPDKGGKVTDWLAIADAYETIKTNKYVPILPSTSTQLLNLTLSLKQQILGIDDLVAIDDGNEEIYMQVKIRPGAVSGDIHC